MFLDEKVLNKILTNIALISAIISMVVQLRQWLNWKIPLKRFSLLFGCVDGHGFSQLH